MSPIFTTSSIIWEKVWTTFLSAGPFKALVGVVQEMMQPHLAKDIKKSGKLDGWKDRGQTSLGLPDQLLKEQQYGAVIFGHNFKWPFHWDEMGETELEKEGDTLDAINSKTAVKKQSFILRTLYSHPSQVKVLAVAKGQLERH
ncbi:hypothetical protein FKW77_009933 [Venturia effusa]|uniref:Uncharacterized protein n=1 Tax=Venturia effusa TaxID=50376 RepID=A0A517L679_9PEZI|nr:hypothetical protein FKW77_009933 [Venturia effusa]